MGVVARAQSCHPPSVWYQGYERMELAPLLPHIFSIKLI